nr:hypothetical protein [uncultured Hyphomonas sp.]
MRKLFTAAPLLVFPVILYAVLAVTSGKADGAAAEPIRHTLDAAIFNMPMISGGHWYFRVGDSILLFGLIMLFIEIIKSTNTETFTLINHGLSMGIFVISLIMFMLLRGFETSEFFLLITMMLLDVVAGFMVTIVAARRDFGINPGFGN